MNESESENLETIDEGIGPVEIPISQTPGTSTETPPAFKDIEAQLRCQVGNWRKRLLDLGNRNPLISCSFNPSRGVIEILHPLCEVVWRKLAADSGAGADPMRFPWRRILVPPPAEVEEKKNEVVRGVPIEQRRIPFVDGDPVASKESMLANGQPAIDADPAKPKEWNPPLDECLASSRLQETDVLTGIGDKAIDRRLRTLDGYAELSMSEQGVHCLYMAFGFLKWFESVDSDKELRSPLMLVPVTLSRASTDAPWELTEAEDDVIDNLCLRQRLKQDFGLELPPLPDVNDLEEGNVRLAFLDAVRNAIVANDRWEVEDRCALGRFAFPKVAMWKDLGDHAQSVMSHELCRSIGGDTSVSPQQAFGSTEMLPNASQLDDEVPPGQVKAILDCDSSQLEAIVAARRGVSFVLDGPPGTGKSQTIANIIADALGEGRRILFVSEKVSALEVVKRRLDDCGLGIFCLECHSSKANRKAVLEELRFCLEIPAEVYDDATPKLNETKQKRDALNDYVRSVHRPREPLGLSPYELYGRVARLTRLGMSTRSRCSLPDPAGVSRETFDSWLYLLGRAKDLGDVMARHSTHPWRGCAFTSRSLSLADDLQHHFGLLTETFSAIESSTRPLINDRMLPTELTPARLNETVKALRESLDSPEVPLTWFGNPRAVADAVLNWNVAERLIDEKRLDLTDYLDDAVERFPNDDVIAICDPTSCAWTGRLIESLPGLARVQRDMLGSHAIKLRDVATRAAATDSALSSLIEQLVIPVKSNVSTSTVPKIIRLARAVAESGPMRPGWFEPDNWTRLRQVCHEAIGKLDDAAASASRVADRIPVERLSGFARVVEDIHSVEVAWAVIQRFFPEAKADHLGTLIQTADKASLAARNASEAASSLNRSLGLVDSYLPSWRSVIALSEAVGPIAEAGMFHGIWRDPEVRSRVRDACDAAIADLAEAAALRLELEERMSHRAFKVASAELANRAAVFESLFHWLFGGFGAFQKDVADLYKGNLPDTQTLLADCDRLRRFHRRVSGVRESAESLADNLPDGHSAYDTAAWNRVRASLSAFESLLNAVPALADSFPRTSVELNGVSVKAAQERLVAELSDLQNAIEESPLAGVWSDVGPLSDLANEITSVAEAGKVCQQLLRRTATTFALTPSHFGALLDDIRDARRYCGAIEEVSTLFDRERDLMSVGSIANDRSGWERTLAGIDAAERLIGLVRSPELLRDILCVEGRIDSGTLAVAADATEIAFQMLDRVLRDAEDAIELSPPGEPTIEPRRRPLAVLRLIADTAAEQIESRVQQLSRLAEVIRPNADVPVERLSEDMAVIAQMSEAIWQCEEAETLLRLNGAVLPGDLMNGGYEAATWLLALVTEGSVSPLVKAVASDAEQRRRVDQVTATINQAWTAEFKESWKFLKSVFDLKADVSTGFTIVHTPVGELAKHLMELRGGTSSLDEWLKFSRWRRDMHECHFGPVVEELLEGKYEAHETADVIAARFYRKLFDQLADNDQALGEFDIVEHEMVRERFRHLDRWEVKAAATRIREYQLGRDDRPRPGWTGSNTSELGILQRETQKKRRNMPLRKLFAEIPSVLQRLKPCIMMSPLSVSTFLQSDEIRFDLVIFDEASQVFPWDAVGAIYRGSQLIVAGDEKQLPPTNFFNRADVESEDEEDDIADFESILSLCKSISMPTKRLRWHYRSRREPLIAFSNRNFYDGDLVTFPSVRDASSDSVRLELVPEGRWIDRKNLAEAERIADLVIAHHRTKPKTSLGVIAFNSSQQQAIEDAIYERRRNDPEIDAVFSVGLNEPMFVKSLENVQGDERDVILLSMGYAYNDAGKFLKNFGPLTKAGGERRLNVAVTRAREQIVFVASVRAADMDLTGSLSEGSHLLKAYLHYAERGIDSLARTIDSVRGECDSPFEEEVAAALIRHGLEPVPQVGCGGFRIDLALKHPKRPGEFCLGIECDGATYHSSQTARDRDRIRQSVLEDLGWQIIRIWSTDWVRDPERQLERILAAYQLVGSSSEADVAYFEHEDSETDAEDDGLQPRYVEHVQAAGVTFDSIDEVGDWQVRECAKVVVVRLGAIDWDELVVQVARELGFKRTGKRIRERLEAVLHGELQSGSLRFLGDRISIQPS